MMTTTLTPLTEFRAAVYAAFDRRRDALFELLDGLLTAGPVASPVHLSLEPVHRRGWGSLYAALARGKVRTPHLEALLARCPLVHGQPIYAVDSSSWPRCDAETSPGRGFYYHPSRHSAGQPIVAGWSYQWVAQLGFSRDSWTAPMDVRRVHPTENANTVAATQIKRLVARWAPRDTFPLFVFDAGYDPVQLTQALGATAAAILVRLRANRCFYADPPPSTGTGRPRRHGAKFVCQEPRTWPVPTATHIGDDPHYGAVRVQAWARLHPVVQNHATRGTRQPRPIVRGTLIRVAVSRLPKQTRQPQVLWLWWHGPGSPDLAVVWRAYVHRFDLEHTFRFLKQTLAWTAPRVRSPEQADRWTWLVALAYTQLRLARPVVADHRLPWERPLRAGQLTPCRVRRAFSYLRPVLGTPARLPKPSGRSPGRPKGRRSGPAPRHPAIKLRC